jgi:nucleoside-diphosphate-sugar epimerase
LAFLPGTSTSTAGCERIREAGHQAVLFDGAAPSADVTAALATATHVVGSAPPGEQGDPVLRHHSDDLRSAAQLKWIGYLSTVGVYGDHGGAWVDETTPANPGSPRSQRRLAAELAWLALPTGPKPLIGVFRLSGIYGVGRSAIDNLRDGSARRIVKPGQVFNRIHVDDIARVLEAAMARQRASAVYNVTDDEPAPPQDVVAFAADLLGVPTPPDLPFATAALSPMARSFYSENKRVRNVRVKQELGITLAYASYREGMMAIAHPRQPGSVLCPCCGFRTLTISAAYDICRICWWEDDGQADATSDAVVGGPNSRYSLTAARQNFMQHGHMYDLGHGIEVVERSTPARQELLAYVRQTLADKAVVDPQRLYALLLKLP